MKAYGRVSTLVLAAMAAACTVSAENDEEFATAGETQSQPIIGGSTASAYPEAAIIDMMVNGRIQSACSGSVIAPKVVLTAGHCVEGYNGFRVKVPFAGNQTVTSNDAATYDWRNNGGSTTVNPNQHDVALIFLPTAITLSTYPAIQKTKLPDGSQLVNVGRINNGSFSNTALFVGQPVTIRDATRSGYPYDYISTEIIQSGDSGGPCIVAGSSPHVVAAVNSGAGGGTQVLARTDLLYDWIQQQITAHGGGGGTTNPPPPPPPPPPNPTCNTPEREPNDVYTSPNALGAQACGGVEGSDQDWYTWTVASAGVAYDVNVKATGDARLSMWKEVSGGWRQMTNNTTTRIAATSSGPGKYVLVVWSPTSAKQTYTVTLAK
jgi:V8-like Glu-specific endopeptidase